MSDANLIWKCHACGHGEKQLLHNIEKKSLKSTLLHYKKKNEDMGYPKKCSKCGEPMEAIRIELIESVEDEATTQKQ